MKKWRKRRRGEKLCAFGALPRFSFASGGSSQRVEQSVGSSGAIIASGAMKTRERKNDELAKTTAKPKKGQ